MPDPRGVPASEQLIATAEGAARAGAAVLKEHAGSITELRTKSASADMVSAADVGAGVAIARALAGVVPGAGFVVEEPEVYDLAGVDRGDPADAAVWVIDPLDGTTSFVHGYPCWSVSIGLVRHGRPSLGVVYNVPANEMICAAEGAGATLNGAPLRISGSPTLERALLATGFPYDRGAAWDRQIRLLERLVRPAHDVRRDGSAAVDLCNVACNRVDGFWETNLQVWDMAAAALIVLESGGLVTGFDGEPWSAHSRDVIAANPALHAVMLAAIREVDACP